MKGVERSCSWLSPFLVRVVFTNLITRVVSGNQEMAERRALITGSKSPISEDS